MQSPNVTTSHTPTSARLATDNASAEPANATPAPIQCFEGQQTFHDEVENNNGVDNVAIRTTPVQSFKGTQQFKGRVVNNNGMHSAATRAAPVQYFSGSQQFKGRVVNNNGTIADNVDSVAAVRKPGVS
ncbi:hypothetical protein BDZ97DRAFT_1922399 [Flammula alnicola]|nr:hypothetical protein BDZ97DRAFT_1922399 [Flammula alnicola]